MTTKLDHKKILSIKISDEMYDWLQRQRLKREASVSVFVRSLIKQAMKVTP